MLQKSESVKYNRLSRRQVLKVLGVVFAVSELTGCASLLGPNSKSDSPYELAPSSKDRLTKAFARIDKQFLRQSFRQVREIQRAYMKGEIEVPLVFKKLRQINEQVFTHYDSIDLIGAIDEAFTVRFILETQKDFNSALLQAIADEGRFTQEEVQQIRGLYQEAREKLLPRASDLNLRKLKEEVLNRLRQLEQATHPQNIAPSFKLEPMMPRWLTCILAVASASGWAALAGTVCAKCAAVVVPEPASCTACAYALAMFIAAEEVALEVC